MNINTRTRVGLAAAAIVGFSSLSVQFAAADDGGQPGLIGSGGSGGSGATGGASPTGGSVPTDGAGGTGGSGATGGSSPTGGSGPTDGAQAMKSQKRSSPQARKAATQQRTM